MSWTTKKLHLLPYSLVSLMNPPSKKPCGRPPGSRNKTKPTFVRVTQFEPVVKYVSVDVPSGSDIIEYIVDVTSLGHVSFSILSATSYIASATLCHAAHGTHALTLHGAFNLLSLTGSYLYNNQYILHPGATHPPSLLTFSVNLSTTQGQVFGGTISGRVVASKDVSIVLSTYNYLEIYRIIPEGEDKNNNNQMGGE